MSEAYLQSKRSTHSLTMVLLMGEGSKVHPGESSRALFLTCCRTESGLEEHSQVEHRRCQVTLIGLLLVPESELTASSGFNTYSGPSLTSYCVHWTSAHLLQLTNHTIPCCWHHGNKSKTTACSRQPVKALMRPPVLILQRHQGEKDRSKQELQYPESNNVSQSHHGDKETLQLALRKDHWTVQIW